MADKPKQEKPAEGASAAPAKKGLPIKTIGIIAALMLIEGVGVFFVLGALGGPKASKAETDPKALMEDTSDKITEMQLLAREDEKFQNLTSGQVWVWNVSVWVQLKKKNTDRIEE